MIVVASILMFTLIGMVTLHRPGRGCYTFWWQLRNDILQILFWELSMSRL